MPLFKRNLQELVADSLEDLSRNTNLTKLSPGGKARAILESYNRRIEEQYEIFDVNLARAFVSSAPGQFLDLIAVLVGLTRETAVAASVEEEMQVIKLTVDDGGTFGSINNGEDIIFSKGTLISTKANGEGLAFRVTSDKVLDSSETEAYLSVTALLPGTISNVGANSLRFHNFTDYSDYLNNSLKVTNQHAIASGKNLESDANFRFRITNRVLEVEAGNETAIRLAALSVPGVADVIIQKHYRGIGTFGVIIKSVTPTVSQNLIDDVEANIERVTSLGDLAFVTGPKEIGITLRTTIHYRIRPSDESLQNQERLIKEAIKNYVNTLDIGEDFLLNRMVNSMFDVDTDAINFGTPGKPIDELYIHIESELQDNKKRQNLLGDYVAADDERVIIEPSLAEPIVFTRSFSRNQ